jgi:hypothetical protein
MSAMIFAAANPGWRVTAVDFMPASIAEARQIAEAAGLDNLTFIEADLASFAETAEAQALPMADTVTLHGVWSWVPEAVRHGIVRLLMAKVASGGLVHVSYNSLPGLQGALAFQRIIREAGLVLARRSDEQAQAGLQVARDLIAAGARHLSEPSIVGSLLGTLEDAPTAYVAHEYMNGVWHPCFHNDVADVMAAAKLDFVGEGSLLGNFAALQMSPEQIAIADRFPDNSRMRQLIVDICRQQGLRHDIFVRGSRKMSQDEQMGRVRDLTLMGMQPAALFQNDIIVAAGQATMQREFYNPIMEVLESGPRRIGELLSLPQLAGNTRNPVELMGMLVGSGQAKVLPFPELPPLPSAHRLNAVLARTSVDPATFNSKLTMVAPRTGGGFPCRGVELFLVDRINATGGAVDPGVWAAEVAPGRTAEELGELRTGLIKVMEDRLAIWRQIGAV